MMTYIKSASKLDIFWIERNIFLKWTVVKIYSLLFPEYRDDCFENLT